MKRSIQSNMTLGITLNTKQTLSQIKDSISNSALPMSVGNVLIESLDVCVNNANEQDTFIASFDYLDVFVKIVDSIREKYNGIEQRSRIDEVNSVIKNLKDCTTGIRSIGGTVLKHV